MNNSAYSSVEKPLVDVIIPVHNASRPIDRAVSSVLNSNKAALRVTVVAHNMKKTEIEAKLFEYLDDIRLRIVELNDGIPSPAGPKNLGLELAKAKYISILDSDDAFEPYAVDYWLQVSHKYGQDTLDGADVVIAPLRDGSGKFRANPPVRIGRMRHLSGYEDRLFYRTGIWGGLIKKSKFPTLRFSEGLPTGEDQYFSAALWSSDADIVFFPGGPAYLEFSDQVDRTTSGDFDPKREFQYFEELFSQENPWMGNSKFRLALTLKFLRWYVLARVRGFSDEFDRQRLAEVITSVLNRDSRIIGLLSRADSRLLVELLNKNKIMTREPIAPTALKTGVIAKTISNNLLFAFHRQSPLRTLFAHAALRLRAKPKSKSHI